MISRKRLYWNPFFTNLEVSICYFINTAFKNLIQLFFENTRRGLCVLHYMEMMHYMDPSALLNQSEPGQRPLKTHDFSFGILHYWWIITSRLLKYTAFSFVLLKSHEI